MSVVNNYILKTPALVATFQRYLVDPLNVLLQDETHCSESFARVDQHAGGPKAMEIGLFLAALNCTAEDVVVSLLQDVVAANRQRLFPYGETPNEIQLFVQTDHGSELGLREIRICIPRESQ